MPVPQAIDAYGARIAPRPSLNPANPAPHTPRRCSQPCPCTSASRSAGSRPGGVGGHIRIQGEHIWGKTGHIRHPQKPPARAQVNTFRPSVDTLAGSGEQVFTPAQSVPWAGCPLRASPRPSPQPARGLALRSQQVYNRACHPHVLSVMPRATCPPSQPPPAPPASHISRYAARRLPVALWIQR